MDELIVYTITILNYLQQILVILNSIREVVNYVLNDDRKLRKLRHVFHSRRIYKVGRHHSNKQIAPRHSLPYIRNSVWKKTGLFHNNFIEVCNKVDVILQVPRTGKRKIKTALCTPMRVMLALEHMRNNAPIRSLSVSYNVRIVFFIIPDIVLHCFSGDPIFNSFHLSSCTRSNSNARRLIKDSKKFL